MSSPEVEQSQRPFNSICIRKNNLPASGPFCLPFALPVSAIVAKREAVVFGNVWHRRSNWPNGPDGSPGGPRPPSEVYLRFHPISHLDSLIVEAFAHFKHFNDPDLEARFYCDLGFYCFHHDHDITTTLQHVKTGLFLAQSNGNLRRQGDALNILVQLKILAGDYVAGRACFREVQKLAKIRGDLGSEAETVNDNFQQGISLMNIAELEVLMGVPKTEIQKKIDASQAILKASKNTPLTLACDTIQADLDLREEDLSSAVFCECFQLGWGKYSEAVSYCVERLGDLSRWEEHHPSSWATVFLAYSLKTKERLAVCKALQFLGYGFLREENETTAIALFTLALEGFTQMDVHRSRAECMIKLGDLSKKHGDLLKALEYWETARLLFQCSSQTKRVHNIDERLVGIGEDVKEQHKRNLAQLVQLNVPTVKVDEVDEDLLDDELEKVEVGLVAA
ncbi:hypothetical protein B0H16DRAFT_1470462 [Mycena metata]|uniref:Uncharacterized protein n=1 Tax=Mycena metata TaxID=1033252 RepID=A0AAD7MQP2_9AGAR|nr:hypothetical protein B0H16DRAFT_1470462 [Mycena metata]